MLVRYFSLLLFFFALTSLSFTSVLRVRACRCPGVISYDNSTRGLDASTALDYAKSLRIMTDIFDMTTFVSIYQAGEGIYDQFDKVLVIDQGRQVYFGPAKEARQYFIDMGYANFPRQTTADFLTGCTDPNERKYASEKHNADNVPSTSEAMAEYYNKSDVARRMAEGMGLYNKHLEQDNPVKEFKQAVLEAKGRGSRKSSPYQISFLSQVWAIARRHTQLKCVHVWFCLSCSHLLTDPWLARGGESRLQDRFSLTTGYGTAILIAIIAGSLFLNIPKTSAGAFTRGGALFIACVIKRPPFRIKPRVLTDVHFMTACCSTHLMPLPNCQCR